MLDKNKTIKFMYRYDENDNSLKDGLVGTLSHIEGRQLASIDDVIKEDATAHESYAWGADGDYLIVKEGLYELHSGSYLRVWG